MTRACGSGRIHLLASCSRGKTAPADDTVYPYHLSQPEEALAHWRRQIALRTDIRPAGELYRGLHWQRAMNAARRHPEVELWVISAGLGLRHITDPAVPYEATFHALTYAPEVHWCGLTARPPLPGRCASLAGLMRACPGDRFVLAVSPVYLRATEADICAGLPALVQPERQLRIVTSGAYAGPLRPWVSLSHAGMLEMLNTNLTALNVSLAAQIVGEMVASPPLMRQSGEHERAEAVQENDALPV